MRISRKQFLQAALASSAPIPFFVNCRGNNSGEGTINEGAALEAEKFADNLGFQVYTVRKLLLENAVSLFKGLSDAGIKNIEFFEPYTLNDYVPIVRDSGMNPLATHFMPGFIDGKWETAKRLGMVPPENYNFENILEDCNKHGISHAGIAIILDTDKLDDFRRFADLVNIKAGQCKSAGIQLYYHGHNFEFRPMDGTTPYEAMLSIFDPDLVKIEFDPFWATVAGEDPVQWLKKLSNRLLFLHMKDLKAGTANTYEVMGFTRENFVELGTGALDWPGILREAKNQGVKYAMLDQDHTQMEDKLASVRLNVDYVKSMNI